MNFEGLEVDLQYRRNLPFLVLLAHLLTIYAPNLVRAVTGNARIQLLYQ